MSKHVLDTGASGKHSSEPNRARCTGEMRTEVRTDYGSFKGRLLRACRKSTCPHHKPEAYAAMAAKHDADLYLLDWLVDRQNRLLGTTVDMLL